MRINVFDQNKKVVQISIKDVLCISRINRRMCYLTEEGQFFGAINLKEQASLYAECGFFRADKNSLINISKIQKIEGKYIVLNDAMYPISRRELINLLKRIKNKFTD